MEGTPRNGSQQQSGTKPTARRGDGPEQRQETESRGSRQRSVLQSGRASRGLAPIGQFGNPFAAMMQLSRQMDRLMDAFFGRPFGSIFGSPLSSRLAPMEGTQAPTMWEPQIDVRQHGDSLVVSADLPGVRKEDINIEVGEDNLTISGQRKEELEEGDEQQGYRLIECSYGSFYRSIPLPDGAKPEEAKASMHDGVLRIEVPLERSARRRQIQIEG